MTEERYNQLNGPDDHELTDEEIKQGWHFCHEFDGLCRNSNDPEEYICNCNEYQRQRPSTICYFTFGQNHIHEYNGIILDRDIVVKITGESEHDCREKMFAMFGNQWCGCYQDVGDPRWYPRGVIEL